MAEYSGPYYYHQLGYQDHVRCLEMIEQGQGDGVILSPRDFEQWPHKLPEYAEQYRDAGTQLLVDPQGFDPSNFVQSDGIHIQDTSAFLNREVYFPYIETSLQYQNDLNVSQYIVPCIATKSLTNEWLDVLNVFKETARDWLKYNSDEKGVLCTLAIDQSEIRTYEQRARLLDALTNFKDIEGFYVIIGEVLPRTTDIPLIMGILDLIFRLKWQGFKVILGYCGLWSILSFPLGLDCFASSGLKNRQQFQHKDWRDKPSDRPGGGGRKFYKFWSPELLDYIRYPDDAQQFNNDDFQRIFQSQSPYSPPANRDPSVVHGAGQWKMRTSFQDYSWKLWDMTSQFRKINHLQGRIDEVRQILSNASRNQEVIGEKLAQIRGQHVQAWQSAFEQYISSEVDIADLFT